MCRRGGCAGCRQSRTSSPAVASSDRPCEPPAQAQEHPCLSPSPPRARIVAAAAVVLAVGVTTTVAAFTDSGQVQTQLATGSLDLKFDDDQQGNPAAYAVQFSDGF